MVTYSWVLRVRTRTVGVRGIILPTTTVFLGNKSIFGRIVGVKARQE